MYDKKLIVTEDGSHSIELVGMNEQYHSVHGAIQESQHVFIEYGLKQLAELKQSITILEVGMGTGLNVLLSLIFAQKEQLKIDYLAVEPYPVVSEIWEKLNYTHQLNRPDLQNHFHKIHCSEWDHKLELSDGFTLLKKKNSILDLELISAFDMIYFDAFNPDLEPDLWTEEVFKKIYDVTNNGGLLSTYSTKGIVKRALKSCGFEIKKKPGPPGKREILNAWKR